MSNVSLHMLFTFTHMLSVAAAAPCSQLATVFQRKAASSEATTAEWQQEAKAKVVSWLARAWLPLWSVAGLGRLGLVGRFGGSIPVMLHHIIMLLWVLIQGIGSCISPSSVLLPAPGSLQGWCWPLPALVKSCMGAAWLLSQSHISSGCLLGCSALLLPTTGLTTVAVRCRLPLHAWLICRACVCRFGATLRLLLRSCGGRRSRRSNSQRREQRSWR